ncbi:hypothetical protein [Paenibacillus sp. YYML68]|uniref:hypothetical protein n=1 Tax=Paenibacillus sp. YYML68 TaxID=2909250 RepID=UPI0024919517|nr:hypothetical protein [Paenibacillus sp. YYML68]
MELTTNPFTVFETLSSKEELEQFRVKMSEGGFTPFRLFLERFRDWLKSYEDAGCERTSELLRTARELFPEPGAFSPSWASIWDEFESICFHKQTVFEAIPASEREGEWQVLIDNPYTNSELVCYPSLSFIEGAYMYAYFRTDLKQNEYIRLQKIQNVIMAFGSDREELSAGAHSNK